MKHIEKYNKFIKLNEDIEINGDIDEYDLGIIKDGLIDLTDLGWKFEIINKFTNDNIYIRLEIETPKISKIIEFHCDFDKEDFDINNDSDWKTWKAYNPTEYDQLIINTTKECSRILLNMLDYNYGRTYIANNGDNKFYTQIILSKNKFK